MPPRKTRSLETRSDRARSVPTLDGRSLPVLHPGAAVHTSPPASLEAHPWSARRLEFLHSKGSVPVFESHLAFVCIPHRSGTGTHAPAPLSPLQPSDAPSHRLGSRSNLSLSI